MNLIPWDGATCPCKNLNKCTCCKLKDKNNFTTIYSSYNIVKPQNVVMKWQ